MLSINEQKIEDVQSKLNELKNRADSFTIISAPYTGSKEMNKVNLLAV